MFRKIVSKYIDLPVQAKASFWFLICAFLQKGISVITTPIFTRLLSTDEYGKFNVFNSWLSIIAAIVSLNLYSGVYTQGLVKYSDDRKLLSSSLQGLTIVLVSFWTAIYLISRHFWNTLLHLTTVQMLAMLLMIWTSAAFNFWAAEQRVMYKYKMLVAVTIVVSFAKPALGIVLVNISDDKVTARIVGLALVELVGYTWFFILQMKEGKAFFSKRFWKYALMFNLPLVPHYLSQTILNNSDRIMIQTMCGDSEAGIYSLAYSLSQIMTLFNTALLQTVNPWIYQKIKDKRINDISRIAYAALIIIAAVNVLLIAFAPEMVAIFAPEGYYDAIWVVPPVAMSVYFMFAYSLFANFEFFYEKTSYITLATAIGAIINIILNYIFIQLVGYYVAGYTTLVCYILYAVFHYCFMRNLCREHLNGDMVYSLKSLLLITVTFMIVGFLFLLTYSYPIVRYLLIAGMIVILLINRKAIMSAVSNMMSINREV